MKELVIYIHVISPSDTLEKIKWLNEFKQLFIGALEKYKISIKSITTDKGEFINSIGGYTQGLYVPIINKAFISSQSELSEFNSIKKEIKSRYSKNAFCISLIEDVLPINYAEYQPFFKFFNQGQFSESTNQIDSHLPGNNTRISFQKNIQALSKEVSDQLLRLSSFMQGGNKVIIGASTNDLEEPLKSLYNFLIERNISVEAPHSISYSVETETYIKSKLIESLKQSWLYIHPYGDGAISPNNILNNNTNLCELQSNLASEYFHKNNKDVLNKNPFQRIIWLPKKTSSLTFEGRLVDRIVNKAMQDKSAEILNCSLDELKQIILDYHKNNSIDTSNLISSWSEENSYDESTNGLETVFVLYEKSYNHLLDELASILSSNNLKMITCDNFDKADDFISSKTNALQNCKGVIILTQNWISKWFSSNLNEVLKVRSNRVDKKYEFISIMSKEISEIPYYFDENISLIRINGKIDNNQVKTILKNKR